MAGIRNTIGAGLLALSVLPGCLHQSDLENSQLSGEEHLNQRSFKADSSCSSEESGKPKNPYEQYHKGFETGRDFARSTALLSERVRAIAEHIEVVENGIFRNPDIDTVNQLVLVRFLTETSVGQACNYELNVEDPGPLERQKGIETACLAQEVNFAPIMLGDRITLSDFRLKQAAFYTTSFCGDQVVYGRGFHNGIEIQNALLEKESALSGLDAEKKKMLVENCEKNDFQVLEAKAGNGHPWVSFLRMYYTVPPSDDDLKAEIRYEKTLVTCIQRDRAGFLTGSSKLPNNSSQRKP